MKSTPVSGISASMRSRGTKELEKAHLLDTKREPLVSFTTEKVRKVYIFQGNAVVEDKETVAKPAKAFAKKPSQGDEAGQEVVAAACPR